MLFIPKKEQPKQTKTLFFKYRKHMDKVMSNVTIKKICSFMAFRHYRHSLRHLLLFIVWSSHQCLAAMTDKDGSGCSIDYWRVSLTKRLSEDR